MVPWLQILDTALGIADLAQTRGRGRKHEPSLERHEGLEAASHIGGSLEARLSAVIVAALDDSRH